MSEIIKFPNDNVSWKDAEALVKQGFATTLIEFNLKQVCGFVHENFTVTENMNKLFYLIRKPWTNGPVSAYALSYHHPLYIVIDNGSLTLKMDRGIVEKSTKPGALEFRYFGFVIRKSKPLKENEKSFTIYNGPYTDDNMRSRIAYFQHLRTKRD